MSTGTHTESTGNPPVWNATSGVARVILCLFANTYTLGFPEPRGGGGGGVLGSGFAGYVPLASQNPHPIIVYSMANYRPHLSHFWANGIVISRTEFNASRMLNIKTTAVTIFQLRIFLFLNPCFPEFSYPKNLENSPF